MSPLQSAQRIIAEHISLEMEIDRDRLADAIRWEIIQQRVGARRPAELSGNVPLIVEQIVRFVDEYCLRLKDSPYPNIANRLQECKRQVLALHGIEVQRKSVASVAVVGQRKKARA